MVVCNRAAQKIGGWWSQGKFGRDSLRSGIAKCLEWQATSQVGQRRSRASDRSSTFGARGKQVPGLVGYRGCRLCGSMDHRAAECAVGEQRELQRLIDSEVGRHGVHWARLRVHTMIESAGAKQDAGSGAAWQQQQAGQRKSSAELQVASRYAQRRRVQASKGAAARAREKAAASRLELPQGACPLPRAKVVRAEARATVKEAEAERRAATWKEDTTRQVKDEAQRKLASQENAGHSQVAKLRQMAAGGIIREKDAAQQRRQAEAKLDAAKAAKEEADKAIAAERKRAARAEAAAAKAEQAASLMAVEDTAAVTTAAEKSDVWASLEEDMMKKMAWQRDEGAVA